MNLMRMSRAIAVLSISASLGAGACTYHDKTDDDEGAVTTTASPVDAGVLSSADSMGAVMSVDSAAAPSPAVTPPASGAPAAPVPAPSTPPANDEGARLLTAASARYAAIRSMTATFAMRTENPLLRTKSEQRGKLYQQRPDRIALRYTQPAGQVLLSDGQYFWLYAPTEMKDQAIRSSAANGRTRSVDLQAQFVGDPVKRFNYTMQGSESVGGRDAAIMTLIPRETAPYRSLKVWIDKNDSLVRRFEFTDMSGVIRHMDLSDIAINSSIPARTFVFTPPAGVKVIDQ